MAFMGDLQSRIESRAEIVIEGYKVYLVAVEEVFGDQTTYSLEAKGYAKGYPPKLG